MSVCLVARVAQLRNSLPAMVVEILEEKLDREYCDNAAKLMLQAVSHPLSGDGGGLSNDEIEEREGAAGVRGGTGGQKNVDRILDLLMNWEPMKNEVLAMFSVLFNVLCVLV